MPLDWFEQDWALRSDGHVGDAVSSAIAIADESGPDPRAGRHDGGAVGSTFALRGGGGVPRHQPGEEVLAGVWRVDAIREAGGVFSDDAKVFEHPSVR